MRYVFHFFVFRRINPLPPNRSGSIAFFKGKMALSWGEV